jgi:hypothetical protein
MLEWIVPGQTVMDALRSSDTLALELDMLDVEIKARMVKGMAALRSAPIPEALVKRMQQQAEVMCIPTTRWTNCPRNFKPRR